MDLFAIRRELMAGKTIYDLPLRVTHYSRVSTEKEGLPVGKEDGIG